MRERAAGAYPGPWTFDEDENCWRLHSAPDPYLPSMQILKAPKRDTPFAEYWPDAQTAEHIVSWSPIPATAVADWLEACADRPDENALRLACAYLGVDRALYGRLRRGRDYARVSGYASSSVMTLAGAVLVLRDGASSAADLVAALCFVLSMLRLWMLEGRPRRR
jgi:hypothetical protein